MKYLILLGLLLLSGCTADGRVRNDALGGAIGGGAGAAIGSQMGGRQGAIIGGAIGGGAGAAIGSDSVNGSDRRWDDRRQYYDHDDHRGYRKDKHKNKYKNKHKRDHDDDD